MSHPAITVDNLSKAYRIGVKDEVPDSLLGALQGLARAPWRNFQRLRKLDTYDDHVDSADLHWALREVSFNVQEGEVLGVIGRNGAGKSTLLKILSRITEPTRGRATIRGRVSSLLEVGTGFHPELSGRENIYLNGTILGMRKREIDRKLDQIIDFSGVEKFLDTPIKRYSSGMKVRLAFAVAAHLEPEILIIDEVLAVGDAEFQQKCMGKMHDVATSGRTVLFVSHNLSAIESLCSHGVLLQHGQVAASGNIEEILEQYRAGHRRNRSSMGVKRSKGRFFQDVSILDWRGKETNTIPVGHGCRIRIEVNSQDKQVTPRIGIGVDDDFGVRQLTLVTPLSRDVVGVVEGSAVIECALESLPLRPGEYSLKLSASQNGSPIESLNEAIRITIADGELFSGGHRFHSGTCVAKTSWSTVELPSPEQGEALS
jgi:lipopolysaccharide transport system ATP-binding protein